MLNVHERGQASYDQALRLLSRRGDADLQRVEPAVQAILDGVAREGDVAVRRYVNQFEARTLSQLVVPTTKWQEKSSEISPQLSDCLREAAERVRAYHRHQRESGFRYASQGIELGQRVRPIRSVGLYAPGGKARYPSTVLMTAIPAQVAGVKRIVLATPSPTPEVLAAASIAGVTEVVDVGGAQAIAALAYGTESVARVDKIVGPGNIYVACAKRLVFGTVAIDSIAGPSEVLVVADDDADSVAVAADLLAQAEHDEDAYPLLITLSPQKAEAVVGELARQLEKLPRRTIAEAALTRNGHGFVCGDRAEAARVADQLAIEHLCLAVQDPDSLLDGIDSVGAVFLGHHTPETAGDYAAGPSHVLPTGGAARFSSPLGVYDFLVRTSLIRYSKQALREQKDLLTELARLEGLEAHARAVEVRLSSE
ncbi:MAG: histidinol dehydrogenase [Myxococcota bacterium]